MSRQLPSGRINMDSTAGCIAQGNVGSDRQLRPVVGETVARVALHNPSEQDSEFPSSLFTWAVCKAGSWYTVLSHRLLCPWSRKAKVTCSNFILNVD